LLGAAAEAAPLRLRVGRLVEQRINGAETDNQMRKR